MQSVKSSFSKMKKSWQLYVLCSIPILYFLVFKYWPMYGAIIAFKDFNPVLGIQKSEFVGFMQFERFFNYYKFKNIIGNTIGISFYMLIAGFPLPIILALSLNASRGQKFKKVVQMSSYAPYFISTVVLVGMMMQFLSPKIGIYATISNFFGVKPVDLFGIPNAFKSLYVWSGVWQMCGWNSIIYIAALSGVDPQLHEAASIDGASRFKRIIHIDLPGIMPTAIILLILNAGRVMNLGFEKVFLMQNSLNLRKSEIIATYVYKVGLASGNADFSYASAIGLFNSVINLILILSVNKIAKSLGETSLW